jgi:hypothetical protein
MARGGGGNSVERKLWRVEGMAGGGGAEWKGSCEEYKEWLEGGWGEQCGKEAVKSRRNGWRGTGWKTERKGSCEE